LPAGVGREGSVEALGADAGVSPRGFGADRSVADEARAATGGGGSLTTPASAVLCDKWIIAPHLRHFIRTERPATLSSATWYFALQLGQMNYIQRSVAQPEQLAGEQPWWTGE